MDVDPRREAPARRPHHCHPSPPGPPRAGDLAGRARRRQPAHDAGRVPRWPRDLAPAAGLLGARHGRPVPRSRPRHRTRRRTGRARQRLSPGRPEMPSRYHRLRNDDTLSIGGRSWRVIVGYGHAPEHASLYCAELGLLISGDMLLPRISTNVSVYAATPHDDALGYFLDSIRELCNLPDDTLVLPSHGKPFKGIRSRVEQLVAHHRERCDALLAECSAAKAAGELLATLFPRELDTHQVMFAMGEAIAHLNHLEKRGALRREVGADGLTRFVNIN
ncbi:MBL fold metallo-hydrolase [Thauera humireducens]|uniref:MBL fold metallo-hydrolase n=1 Tax=Thauera humireducens TaxID=1134435 RepID=UPI00311E6584